MRWASCLGVSEREITAALAELCPWTLSGILLVRAWMMYDVLLVEENCVCSIVVGHVAAL